jgi:hypothetical protein
VTNRHFTTDLNGPIVLNASILGIGGYITVDANEKCTHATITVRTNDEKGPAAEAVRNADLGQEGGYLVARVTGEDHGSGVTQSVFTRGGRTTVIQSGNVVRGNVTGMTIINGKVITGGNSSTVEVSPVEITVTVPVGSSLIAHADSADVSTTGPMAQVAADTQSGRVDVDHAQTARAKTMSGRVDVGVVEQLDAHTMSGRIEVRSLRGSAQLNTMSGRIEAHAMTGGHITANTMSGRIEVTATQAALTQGLRVRADSMSGRVRIPSQCAR